MSKFVEYHVDVHVEGDEGMWAEVVELPGCFASGFTRAELDESLREAIELYLSTPESRVRVSSVSAPPLHAPLFPQPQSPGVRRQPTVELRDVELMDA